MAAHRNFLLTLLWRLSLGDKYLGKEVYIQITTKNLYIKQFLSLSRNPAFLNKYPSSGYLPSFFHYISRWVICTTCSIFWLLNSSFPITYFSFPIQVPTCQVCGSFLFSHRSLDHFSNVDHSLSSKSFLLWPL